jgi:hypothetical protein
MRRLDDSNTQGGKPGNLYRHLGVPTRSGRKTFVFSGNGAARMRGPQALGCQGRCARVTKEELSEMTLK